MQMSTALTNLLNVLGLILLGLVNSLLVKLRFNKASYPGSSGALNGSDPERPTRARGRDLRNYVTTTDTSPTHPSIACSSPGPPPA